MMVSLVTQPGTPFVIFLCQQASEVCVQMPGPLSGLVAEGLVSWLFILGR